MKLRLLALPMGFVMDLLLGDPERLPHPVQGMGLLISSLERQLRRLFPRTPPGEQAAGGVIWLTVSGLSWGVPALLLFLCRRWAGELAALALESFMCWQILAVNSLRREAMRVFRALREGTLAEARAAVARIVGRDTARLDAAGVARAAVETVAEGTCDGVAAPLLFLALGGAPLGFFYKAVNTMDSMLGYTDPPWKDLGRIPARMDDAANFLPARLCGPVMLAAGGLLGMDVRNGWRIFRRDRLRHASPNSGHTEAACAGLLGLRLGGDARYHGVLHHKPTIGDPLREITPEDIPAACRLEYAAAVLLLLLCLPLRFLTLSLWG